MLEVRGRRGRRTGCHRCVALNLGDEPLRVADPAPAADGWVAGRDAGLDGDVLVVGAHGWAVVAPRR